MSPVFNLFGQISRPNIKPAFFQSHCDFLGMFLSVFSNQGKKETTVVIRYEVHKAEGVHRFPPGASITFSRKYGKQVENRKMGELK